MIGLEKLSTLGFEGGGGRVGSLFLNGVKLPLENKKLVSHGIQVVALQLVLLIKVGNLFRNQKVEVGVVANILQGFEVGYLGN